MMITLSPENREENIQFLVKQGEVTGIKLASEITNKHRWHDAAKASEFC